MYPPPLHHVFHPANADHYAATIGAGLEHLLGALGGVAGRQPAPASPRPRPGWPRSTSTLRWPARRRRWPSCRSVWLDDAVWFHEPTYAAHLNCPVVVPALLAELFIASVNSSMDTFDQSVGGTFVERHLIDWTAAPDRVRRGRRRRLHQRRLASRTSRR